MSVTQSGTRITGTGCSYALNPIILPARQFTVTGEYPHVRFVDPFVASCEYEAKFEEDQDEIAGDCGSRSLVRFTRGGSGQCDVNFPLR